ncbi:MAG: hypothetical protein JW830_16205 [Bacteroidales bacterium]|nr:hypothetical protein [Bacteroidales bacterium]
MIQEIHPHVFSNIFMDTGICDDDYIFHFKDDAGWYTRDNLSHHPTTISIAGEMIEKFGKGILTPENNRSSF